MDSDFSPVTQAQIDWILSRIKALITSGEAMRPFSDEAWSQIMEQTHDTETKSRRHPLTIMLQVAVLKYFEEADKHDKNVH